MRWLVSIADSVQSVQLLSCVRLFATPWTEQQLLKNCTYVDCHMKAPG